MLTEKMDRKESDVLKRLEPTRFTKPVEVVQCLSFLQEHVGGEHGS
jgi:hypothetical protein